MIPLQEVESLHRRLIQAHGGIEGIRDLASLQSALERPFQSFEGLELYPTTLHKGAALIESLISNHPFLDGNKRTAYVLLRLFLIHHAYDLNANEEEKYDFVISIASGTLSFDDILQWLEAHVK